MTGTPVTEAFDRSASLRVERIAAEDHQELLRELGIDSLPTLEICRDGGLVWRKAGCTSREEVIANLDRVP